MLELAVVVTSDKVYRGEKPDKVRRLLSELEAQGRLQVIYYAVAPNDPGEIRRRILEATSVSKIVLVTGGTGVSPRDVSVDVARQLASRELPGFGEAHRRLSMEEIGLRAVMSRASAFIVNGSLVAVSPGSTGAVKTALSILEEIHEHLVEELEGRGHGKH